MATEYTKIYLRENSLMALQIWDEHQSTPVIDELWGQAYAPFVWHIEDGVASTYMPAGTFAWVAQRLTEKTKDQDFIPGWLARYERELIPLEAAWRAHSPLPDRQALLEFCDRVIHAWLGLEITYFAPMLPAGAIPEQDRQAALKLRERAAAFLDDSDRVILSTLRQLYPELGDLMTFIGLHELREDTTPSSAELARRRQGVILHAGQLHTLDLKDFLAEHDIHIPLEVPEHRDELRGQIAMTGQAAGRAYVLLKKSDVHKVQDGDILVSGMTVPDYLPAMQRAAAFVTDEGGITCHAAIVAREFAKPCVIGTKFATQLIKTGDWLEVDADAGIVKINSTEPLEAGES